MFCKSCGEQIDNDSKFCTHCGTKLAKESNGPTVAEQSTRTTIFVSTQPTKESIYDESFERENYISEGFLLLLVSIAVSSFSSGSFKHSDNSDGVGIFFVCLVSMGIRIAVAVALSRYAKKLNRNTEAWGLYGFLAPSIALIVISYKKKYKRSDNG